MLIYGVSGIFAHKKTITQFLQPMVEQVWGGGGGGGVDVPLFFGQFFRATLFLCQFFFQFTDALFGSILPIFAYFFCCISCVFHQKVKQCFGHKIFVWFLYSWAYFLITASIFLGSIFDTGYFIFCSTVLSLSGTLPPFFYDELPSFPGSMHYKTSKMVM